MQIGASFNCITPKNYYKEHFKQYRQKQNNYKMLYKKCEPPFFGFTQLFTLAN